MQGQPCSVTNEKHVIKQVPKSGIVIDEVGQLDILNCGGGLQFVPELSKTMCSEGDTPHHLVSQDLMSSSAASPKNPKRECDTQTLASPMSSNSQQPAAGSQQHSATRLSIGGAASKSQ